MDQTFEDNSSLMAMIAGAGLSRPSNDMSQNRQAHDKEQSFSNHSRELHAANDDGDDALQINEVDSSISPSNKYTHGGIPNDDQGGILGSPTKKKRLQRLTSHQAQLLEGYFSICAHPDDSQRKLLSEKTGLAVQQVKFWFQNKRTQVKHLSGKEDNYRLKVENEMLRNENRRLKQAHSTTFCASCSDSEAQKQLAAEMEKLKEQNVWMEQELSRFHAGTPPSPNIASQLDSSAENVLARQNDAQMITELANNATHEFVVLAESHGPLWLSIPGGSFEILNKMAYAQKFPGTNTANVIGFKTEATRADAVVMLDPNNIVDFLMDPECYGTFCPGLLSSVKTTKVYKGPTDAGYDGAMQLMTIETVFPSPLVPARKCTFVRYCRKLQEGTVVVVDVSLDDGNGAFFKCRKLPSGVLIQSIRANSCKVTAIEHVQVDDTGVHELYQPCLSGLFFGARRWVTSMARQCARMRDVFHVTSSSLRFSSKGRKTIMKLADDLLVSYTGSIATTPQESWTVLRGAGTEEDIKIAYRRNDGDTNTAIVSASASFRLPLTLRKTYYLLRNNLLRSKWDVLVNGGVVKEEVRVSNGVGGDDAVSILHVKHGEENKVRMMILQNSSYDVSGSFMVYSPVDNKLMNTILSPGDPTESKTSLYPTGFSLVPVGEPQGGVDLGENGGTLMTVGFQILLKLARGTGLFPRSVSSAVNLMSDNIYTIKETLTSSHSVFHKRNKSAI